MNNLFVTLVTEVSLISREPNLLNSREPNHIRGNLHIWEISLAHRSVLLLPGNQRAETLLWTLSDWLESSPHQNLQTHDNVKHSSLSRVQSVGYRLPFLKCLRNFWYPFLSNRPIPFLSNWPHYLPSASISRPDLVFDISPVPNHSVRSNYRHLELREKMRLLFIINLFFLKISNGSPIFWVGKDSRVWSGRVCRK